MRRLLSLSALVGCLSLAGPSWTQDADFVRGDFDSSGDVTVGDAHLIACYNFDCIVFPPCLAAADTDGDGVITIADAVYLLEFLSGAGPAPAAPFPEPGPDSSGLKCEAYRTETSETEPGVTLHAESRGDYEGGDVFPAVIELTSPEDSILGWSFGLELVSECRVLEATVEGTVAAREEDGGSVDATGFAWAEVISDAERSGLVTAAILSLASTVVLPPEESPHVVLAFTWEPGLHHLRKNGCYGCDYRFVENLGSPPVALRVIVADDRTLVPSAPDQEMDSCIFLPPRPLPGDCNRDRIIDMSDAITILLGLFVDPSIELDEMVCDADGSRSIGLTDAIRLLNFLFLGGPSPEPVF